MSARLLAAAGLALVLADAPAFAGERAPDPGMATAESACTAVNEHSPVEVAATVPDGVGDWVVWLKDKDADLWLCNASSAGAVYANTMMEGDLLAGDGTALVGMQPVSNPGRARSLRANPAETATALCVAVGSYIEDMQVVATVEDGVGDYLVWLQNADEAFWLCNASADAKLYDFEPVDMPLNDFHAVETRSA